MAAFRPSWASEMTSFTPFRPRRTRPRSETYTFRDPEGGGFRLTQAEPEDLAATVLVDAGGDYGGDRHDAPLLADLDVGGVQPEIGPVAVQRPLEERQHTGVNLLA
jgi:hypothetical protein